MSDLIDRALAQTEIQMACKRLTLAYEAHGEGQVAYSDEVIKVSDAIDALRNLPSAQPDASENTCEITRKQNDTISRQDAIRWVKTECNPYGRPTLDYKSGIKVIEHLKRMPSAQPERKMGEWIDKSGGIYGAWNYCSVCGEQAIDLFDFCPNCGADMRGEEG